MKYQHKITKGILENLPVMIIEGDLTSEADSEVKNIYTDLKTNFALNKMIINFEKTKYINSSGIATLINIIQDVNEKNGAIAFVGLSEHLQKVMDIVGISDFVKICKTNDEAFKALA